MTLERKQGLPYRFFMMNLGHTCQKVKWSLVSLNMSEFKMHKPQILVAIRPEFGHEILNGSLSSWIIDMPSS